MNSQPFIQQNEFRSSNGNPSSYMVLTLIGEQEIITIRNHMVAFTFIKYKINKRIFNCDIDRKNFFEQLEASIQMNAYLLVL